MENTLFNETTVRRMVSETKLTTKQKKASQEWLDLIERGELMKEKLGYLKFYDIILKDLLGYDNIKHEKEGVEFSYEKDGRSVVRIETKGMDTKDLFLPQKRANEESPVQQLWRYMNKFATPYGIVTNYKYFILFKYDVGNTKYYLFDFEEIKRSQNRLNEFVAIFSRESIDKGFIEKLYEKSVIEEREFTKEFYKLYHETRLMLIKEFESNSEGLLRHGAVHFAQIFLNRLMFVFFAEDTGKIEKRLVEDKVMKTLENVHLFSSNSSNISNVLTGFFKDLDKGSDFPNKVFGFNGGLFQHPIPSRIYFTDFRDERFFKEVNQYSKLKNKGYSLNEKEQELFEKYKNKLNPIIKNILLMASFDFNTEVNVNILGHIFEQSISDIEDLKTDRTSRRKKEGIFYTPEYITDYICRNTIVPYLSDKGAVTTYDLIKEYSNNIGDLEKKFKEMKILDPACGSGAFLIKATDVMLEIFKAIQEFKQQEGQYEAQRGLKKKSNNKGQLILTKWNEEDEAREIIENNIYGVDINEESVEITKLSLFLKMARKNRKLTDLSNNIKQGNSLIDNEDVAGKLAFNWNEQFKEIMGNGGFDVVIGNPPYVRADVDDENYKKQRELVIQKGDYKTLYEKWDLYLAFIERGLNLLSDEGNFSMIIPDAFCTAKYASKMREYLSQNKQVNQIDYYPNDDIFKGVGVKNVILFVENSSPTKKTNKIIHKDITKIDNISEIDLRKSGQDGFRLNYVGNKKSYGNSELLGNTCFVSVGMVLNANELTTKGEFKKDDLISDKEDKIHSRKYVEAKNIQKYLIKDIKYLEWGTKRVPKKIRRPTFPELYEGEKLIFGGMTGATYDNKEIMHNHSIFTIKRFIDLRGVKNKSIESSIKKWNKKQRGEIEELSQHFDLKYILAILNSEWALNFLKTISRNKLGFYPDDIKQLPIKIISPSEQEPFIEKAELMLELNKEFYERKDKFLKLIKHEYKIDKLPQKLDKFYELDFDEFVKQLKVKLNIEKKSELMEFLEKNKKEVKYIAEMIEKTDREIDEMVYKLYGISADEQKIIEESPK